LFDYPKVLLLRIKGLTDMKPDDKTKKDKPKDDGKKPKPHPAPAREGETRGDDPPPVDPGPPE